MAKNVKVTLNTAGLSELLTSPGVVAELGRVASRMQAANPTLAVEPGISPGGGRVPARAHVRIGYPSSMNPVHAMRSEAKHGTLARALGAAGGGG